MTSLGDALDALETVARQAGVPGEAARAEALALVAAVAESAPGAAADWAAVTPGATTRDFFEAAVRGRRWRGAPTAVLTELVSRGAAERTAYAEALAGVVETACDLGEPTVRVIGNASVTAAVQLRAAGALPSTDGTRPGTDSTQTGTSGTRTGTDRTPPRIPFGDSAGAVPGSRSPEGVPGPESAEPTAPVEPVEPARGVEELLAELDALIGLERVKREVHRQVALLRIERLRTEAGLRSPTVTRHLVFVGNPGTGKTTVARLVSGIYHALGLLSKGQLIEVDRSELVAGYLGQTAVKTAEVVASAAGGVLFVDEAYSLTGSAAAIGGPDQYGQEAVDTLVKEMEDRRGDLVVIVAGYPEPMERFISANPGLASRFRTTIHFDDYTDDELTDILLSLAADADYELTPEAVDRFRELLAATPRDSSFGNGRYARNLLEAAIGRHAWRLRDHAEPNTAQLRQIVAADLTDEAEPATQTEGSGATDETDRPAGQAEPPGRPPETGPAEPTDRTGRPTETGQARPADETGPAGPPAETDLTSQPADTGRTSEAEPAGETGPAGPPAETELTSRPADTGRTARPDDQQGGPV